MSDIREFLDWQQDYFYINREERNFAAILYHLLLLENNCHKFLKILDCDFEIVSEEFGIYYEYAYMRDLWQNIGTDNGKKRRLVLEFLPLHNRRDLEKVSVCEFNKFFGAVPTPSRDYIQFPGNWSVCRFEQSLSDSDEFYRVCRFKWGFNIKPDIVVHTSRNQAICIEAKYESGVAFYPSNSKEVKLFRNRNLGLIDQTDLQVYMMKELLGIETQFLLLTRENRPNLGEHKSLTWKKAFASLDARSSPSFIRKWIERESQTKNNLMI